MANVYNQKLKSLWNCILDLNTTGESEDQGDNGSREFTLILESFFNFYIKLKTKLKENETTQQSLRSELTFLKRNLQQKEDELICHQALPCCKCTELEQEVATYKKRLSQNESRIKSIANILNLQDCSQASEDLNGGNKRAVTRAFNLMSQMLFDPPKSRRPKSTGSQEDELDESCLCETLAPETLGIIRDPFVKGTVVPETLCLDELKNDPPGTGTKTLEQVIELPFTPKKQVMCHKEKTRKSPVLGNASKRQTSKTLRSDRFVINEELNSPSLLKDTSEISGTGNVLVKAPHGNTRLDAPKGSETETPQIKLSPQNLGTDTAIYKLPHRVSGKLETGYNLIISPHKDSGNVELIDDILKPPLSRLDTLKTNNVLKSLPRGSEHNASEYKPSSKSSTVGIENTLQLSVNIHPSNNTKHTQSESVSRSKRKRADYWQLKTTYNMVEDDVAVTKNGGCRKLKQTQLALGCFAKKLDVCTLKEFNGGIRQTSTQVSIKLSNTDMSEDKLFEQAIQESLKGKENCEVDMALGERDDDIVMESPNASQANGKTRRHLQLREASESVFHSRSHRKMCDMDETHFSPMVVVEMNPRQPLDELAQPECSFDRLPDKSTSTPDFKYRRNAVRKKEERKKLEGWDCDQCRQYYNAAGGNISETEMKMHMDRCSRHRDKYKRSATPPGFWDAEFPNTQECRARKLDVTQIDTNRAQRKAKKNCKSTLLQESGHI